MHNSIGIPWNELVDRYGHALNLTITGILRRAGVEPRPQEVEELVQEVYCRLLDGGATCFRGRRRREIWTFLIRAAKSVVLDHLRISRAAKRGGAQAIQVERIGDGGGLNTVPDSTLCPEKRLLDRERCHLFFDRCRSVAGQRTRERDLSILRLALIEGWSSREICQKLPGALTPSCVDTVIHRMKRRLSQQGIEVSHRL